VKADRGTKFDVLEVPLVVKLYVEYPGVTDDTGLNAPDAFASVIWRFVELGGIYRGIWRGMSPLIPFVPRM
jgi:hypothetical protein